MKTSDTGDFLDSLLAEWFGAPDYSSPQTPGLLTEHSVVDSVADFDLSLLEPSSSSSSSSSEAPALFAPRRDSLLVRVLEIEDRLGVFNVSVRGVRPRRAIESMSLACQELVYSSVSRDSFAVVRVLDSRSPGVLLRVASLQLKHRILECKDALKCLGLVMGLA